MSDWLCGNWSCPARRSCALHFGRSDAYAAMAEKHPPLRDPQVEEGEEDCEHYRRDRFKAWVVTNGFGRQLIDTPPGWMIL